MLAAGGGALACSAKPSERAMLLAVPSGRMMSGVSLRLSLVTTLRTVPVKAYAYNEVRYRMLSYTNPREDSRLLELAQADIQQRWLVYSHLAERWPVTMRRGQGEAGSHVPAPPEAPAHAHK